MTALEIRQGDLIRLTQQLADDSIGNLDGRHYESLKSQCRAISAVLGALERQEGCVQQPNPA